jgi:hypothetical protein
VDATVTERKESVVRVVLGMIALATVIVVAGCGGSKEGEATATTVSSTTTPPTAEQTEVAPTTTVRVELKDGSVIYADDFSDPTVWGTEVVPNGEYDYAKDAYRILVKGAGRQLNQHLQVRKRVEGMRVAIQATQVAGRSGDALGIKCYTDVAADDGYMLVIAPADRNFAILSFHRDSYQLLEGSDEPVEGIRAVGKKNRLEAQCAHVPDGPNWLSLAVNGEVLGDAFDERLTGGFNAFGMVVDTATGGADGRFDNLVAVELVAG